MAWPKMRLSMMLTTGTISTQRTMKEKIFARESCGRKSPGALEANPTSEVNLLC